MKADGCRTCKSTSLTHSAKTSSAPASSTSAAVKTPKTCPRELTGDFEFPHLIVPVDSVHPDKAHGTAFNGTISGTISSIFNFDIPAANKDKTCTLEFLFPFQDQLKTSAFEFSGPGRFHVSTLKSVATKDTTFHNIPAVWAHMGEYSFTPGTATTIGSWPCFAPTAFGVMISAENETMLNYFQDSNPCPIGLYTQVF